MGAAFELLKCESITLCLLNEDSGKYQLVHASANGKPVFEETDTLDDVYEYTLESGPLLVNSEAEAKALDKIKLSDGINSLLVVPALDDEDGSTSFMSFKNKLHGKKFTRQCLEDGENLAYLGELIFKLYITYQEEVTQEIKCRALLDIIKAVGSATPETANSFFFTVSRRSQELFNAEKCTMYVVDKSREVLWSATTDSGKQIRIPMSSGIVGAVATSCEIINIANAYEDPRFSKTHDSETGYKTKSILCAPVVQKKSTEKECVAVIQLINKSTSAHFSKEEEEVLNQLCEILGDKITDDTLLECFRAQFVVNTNTVVNEAKRKLSTRTRRRSITTSISEDNAGIDVITE